jgi:carbamate kinase
VVPSPNPLQIVEKDTIKKLVRDDIIVIAAGGGGMPVYIQPDNTYEGIDAVVDKDLASAVLASDIEADELTILTSVERIFLGFGTEKERPLTAATREDLVRFLGEGHFPPGSMGPKVRSIIRFLREGGRKATIGSPYLIPHILEFQSGTHVYPDIADMPDALREEREKALKGF